MQFLSKRAKQIKLADLAIDLLPLFEGRAFIENWIAAFQENFATLARDYL